MFYIEGSQWNKEDYYIRPGIFINELMVMDKSPFYGDCFIEIDQTTPEEVIMQFEKWYYEWTNKSLIKERYLKFIEWDKRNPFEKCRAGLVDYEKDQVPQEHSLQFQ